MPLTFEKLHPHFAAEVGPIDLRRVRDPESSPRSARAWTNEHHGRGRWAKKWARSCRSASLSPLSSSSIVPP
jgi:hypothetical protein